MRARPPRIRAMQAVHEKLARGEPLPRHARVPPAEGLAMGVKLLPTP